MPFHDDMTAMNHIGFQRQCCVHTKHHPAAAAAAAAAAAVVVVVVCGD